MNEAKRVNSIFSSIMVITIASELAISLWLYNLVDLDNLMVNEGIVEGMLFLPALIGVLILRNKEESLCDRLMFRKLRLKAIFPLVLYGIVIIPIGTLANAVSLLFTDNTVTESSSLYLNQNIMTALVFVAVVGPFVEEFVFRAVIYNGYRKAGGRMGAVVLSSLLFGLMHLNLNQLVYAFTVGMLLALVAEAAGSVWASLIGHLVFNAENVIMMFLADGLFEEAAESSYDFSKDELMDSIILYAIIAAIAIFIIVLLLRWISNIQGTSENMKEVFSVYEKEERKNRLITPVLFVGIIISVGYIILYELIKYV